eukprot:GHVP01015332.1.p1 GENE.GHVP01015332.1~~GHVP01015332.1.p1  ORF type:complete len:299 (+),score=60.65 GHVP01015332.1:36-932(+)
MRKPRRILQEGDWVIFCGGPSLHLMAQLQRGKETQCRIGTFSHNEAISKVSFGSKIWDRKKEKWIAILEPTPDLLTETLLHQTQILRYPDIPFIISMLGLKPGSLVVESGTGSCSLSVNLAAAVAPNGRLETFEVNEGRHSNNKETLKNFDPWGVVNAELQNVCVDAFPSRLTCMADAVFLDLPEPWEAVGSATTTLKSGGRLVTFSPCIEQVKKTVEILKESGHFYDLQVYECLKMEWNVWSEKNKQLNEELKKRKLEKEIEEKDFLAKTERRYLWSKSRCPGHSGYLTRGVKRPDK